MASDHPVKSRKPLQKRYYVRGKTVPFEEDATHEFKGHKNMCIEEIPPWSFIPNSDKKTRAPISRTINGFLNSAQGGTVYLGIVDTGVVKGLNLTIFRRDHIIASLDDLMTRYDPPVENHRYKINFVPVVDDNCPEEEILQIVNYDPGKQIKAENRRRPHLLRSHNYCWCDKDSIAQYNNGIMANDYIVEIHILPWDKTHPENKHAVGAMKTSPIHEDECDNAYFRRQASLIQFTPHELYEVSKQKVRMHYLEKTERLREELERLRAEKNLQSAGR